MNLEGKCAVVTGGAHGIGRALAEKLASEGMNVVVADLNQERAERVAKRINGLAVVCNVGDPAAIKDLVRLAVEAFGPVHVFCSNAGYSDRRPGLDETVEEVVDLTNVNLLSHVWAAQEVVPGMIERGEGYIVQTISSASLITGPSGMAYTFTKHGALGFAEWLALNYAHKGVHVTCLCPNAVNTGMMGRNEDDGSSSIPADLLATIGDIVEPELCADMTLDAMRDGKFLVLPHPRVGESFLRKATDYDKWIEGTNRRLRRMAGEEV